MKLTVPVWTVTDENRDEYTRLLRACGADRVFLVVPGVADYRRDAAVFDREMTERNIAHFRAQGWEVILWVAHTVGHGGKCVPESEYRPAPGFDFQPLVDPEGGLNESANCPLDGDFRLATCDYLRLLATTQADGLLLDDDFRLSMHAGTASLSCFCPLHLARVGKYLGREVDRETVVGSLCGKPNAIRSAFLRAQGDSLREFAREIRQAVDTVDPRKRIGLCSCVSLWNVDGADGAELSYILAGKNTKPLLRTMGAPYWACTVGRTLSEMTEIARSMAALSYGKGIELLPEGDVYPRPSNIVPAAFLEAWDALTRADGTYGGAFKYMFVYDEEPAAEPRYITAHLADKELLEKITDLGKTTSPAGVFVKAVPHAAEDADLTEETFSPLSPRPTAGTFLCEAGIPASYLPTDGPVAAFGSSARYLSAEEKKKPLLLDAVAANILTRAGVDVGLSAPAVFEKIAVGKVYDVKTGYGSLTHHTEILSAAGTFRDGVRVEAEVSVGSVGLHTNAHGRVPFAYTYENADGNRFFVMMLSADGIGKGSSLYSNHAVGAVLHRAMTFFGTAPAVVCPSAPNHLALTVRKTEDGTAVVFVNLGADRVTEPTFTLSDSYSRAKFFGCGGELSADGRSFTLSAPIEAYRFGYVRLFD